MMKTVTILLKKENMPQIKLRMIILKNSESPLNDNK